MTALKPCPFCGSDAVAIMGQACYYVRCSNHNCAITRYANNMDEAVMKWNERANE